MASPNAVRLSLADHSGSQRSKDSSAIEEAISQPGAVNIDVTGAFITPERLDVDGDDGISHHSEDIRLPHHTSIVSHVAVDVSRAVASRAHT